ncbi:tRNA-splicing endonuclease subunit Sen34-like [Ruditapes philippinarum]|uniref:tRNA-splicing endonuclease subunit Sen34-like n=1 Tax=Ruditapes philippinarum TaxID=129788 RepID=UPI00295BFC90|nr:tRNA-splicing endonuclease subunit Sen34-like [Ruditapes philippinarum]
MSSDKELLKIQQLDKDFFVWNSNDARCLRENYKIVGTLIGCLPRAPRQNAQLGLPLQLMPEEVRLLIDIGVAEVVTEGYIKPTVEDIRKYEQNKEESYKEQIELFRNDRRDEIRRKLPDIIEGKKKKRNKLLLERREKGEHIDDAEFEKEIEMNADSVEIPPIRREHMLLQIHGVCTFRQKSCHAVDWQFPCTNEEKLRYRVYRDFWERGHFLTLGSKFGGNFLVYPGDPSRFHSFFIAICKPHKEKMTALDVVSMGRLGTSVKKTVVICSEDENGQLCYTSLQWTGIS